MHRRTRAGTAAILILVMAMAAACSTAGRRASTGTSSSTSGPTAVSTSAPPSTTAGPASTLPPPVATTRPPVATTTTTVPAPLGPARVITLGNTSRRVVALTFDAGSDAGYTSTILGILQSEHVAATFCLTGLWAQANPGLVHSISAGGYQIVNHSWDHRSFTGVSTGTAPLTTAERLQELQRADQLIRQLTGKTTQPWFRPPYGDRDAGVDAVVGSAGYGYELMWTVDSLGWQGLAPSAVTARVLAHATPGAIILMHVGSQSTDAQALPSIISSLRQQGYGFVTAAQIVA